MRRQSPATTHYQSGFLHLGKSQGQGIQHAMDKPCPRKTTFVIMVPLLPGKNENILIYKVSAFLK